MSLAKQLADHRFTISVSEARRLVAMGAVKVNGNVAISDDLQLQKGDEVKIGKKQEPRRIE